jgi:hypothetical protein
MVLLFHGAYGGWDELLIALVAFGVLWIAVKLAGRKSGAGDDDEEDEAEPGAAERKDEPSDVAQPPATRLT